MIYKIYNSGILKWLFNFEKPIPINDGYLMYFLSDPPPNILNWDFPTVPNKISGILVKSQVDFSSMLLYHLIVK